MEIMHSELQKRKNFENQYLEILSKDVRKIPFPKESNEGGKFLVCGIFRIGSTFRFGFSPSKLRRCIKGKSH